jgi:hypothetical protein
MFFVLGPYIAIGLGGDHKYDYTTHYNNDATIVHREGSDMVMFGAPQSGNTTHANFDRRWEFGLQPGLGMVVFKKVLVECRTGIGTVNLFRSRNSRNETLILSASFPFSLKRVEE